MTTDKLLPCREAFEAWFLTEFESFVTGYGRWAIFERFEVTEGYRCREVDTAYRAWRAPKRESSHHMGQDAEYWYNLLCANEDKQRYIGDDSRKVAADLTVILSEAHKNGTLGQLSNVAVYFTADEMAAVLTALGGPTTL
jgi:hypothetical protein